MANNGIELEYIDFGKVEHFPARIRDTTRIETAPGHAFDLETQSDSPAFSRVEHCIEFRIIHDHGIDLPSKIEIAQAFVPEGGSGFHYGELVREAAAGLASSLRDLADKVEASLAERYRTAPEVQD